MHIKAGDIITLEAFGIWPVWHAVEALVLKKTSHVIRGTLYELLVLNSETQRVVTETTAVLQSIFIKKL